MKCAFLSTKIGSPFEAAKQNLLKSVKGFEKERYTLEEKPEIRLTLRVIIKSVTIKSYPTCLWRKW